MLEMINNVLTFPQLPDVAQIKPSPDALQPVAPSDPVAASKEQGGDNNLSHNGQDKGPPPEYSLRLTVDKDPKTGDWVYKAINRYTGEVVRQLPRQELLDMRSSVNYEAGSVIKTDI